MVCGVNLGILVVCLVQVEYVCSLWEMQGKGFKKQNANMYDPSAQNRLRQASFPSGFDQRLNQGLSGSSYSEAASELRQNSRSGVQYVKSRLNPQEPNGGMLGKWPLRVPETAGLSSVSEYGSPEKTYFTAVRNPPVQGSQGHRPHVSSGSSRQNYAFRRPHMTPVDPESKVQTSATVRGKLVHSPKKRTYNQKARFPFNSVQVNQYYSSPRLANPQSYNGYRWSQPQSNFNQKTPNDRDASSTVTYRVADEYGGAFIIRLKTKDPSEVVRPLETQTVFQHNQGQKVPKSVWRKIWPNMMPLN